jgi:hypothetical protein
MLRKHLFGFSTLLVLAASAALPASAHAGEISVSVSGGPGAAVFTISGSGFPINTGVRIQGTRTDTLVSGSAVTTSSNSGTISLVQSISGIPSGVVVNFAATTDGIHWSNVVRVSAP